MRQAFRSARMGSKNLHKGRDPEGTGSRGDGIQSGRDPEGTGSRGDGIQRGGHFVRRKFLLFGKARNIMSTKVNGHIAVAGQRLYTYRLHLDILCV
jgi:hypothetical protein